VSASESRPAGGGASRAPLRIFVGAFGDPGHAFPAIALGKALRARGHQVAVQTWRKWADHVEREGMSFYAAPEYQVFPTRERPLKPYEAVVRAARETRPVVREYRPAVVVSDILTLAPALAAELEGCPWATLVPHVYPPGARGVPPYGLGAIPARSMVGKAFWRILTRPLNQGLVLGRAELNETRRRVGLGAIPHFHGGVSRQLCIVGTFPHLEYPREWPPRVHVTGPLLWEPPSGDVAPPPGDQPLVIVAPSTSQDPDQQLVDASLRGLADLPIRLLAIRRADRPPPRTEAPANARLVEWLPYSRTMPLAQLIVCHGGHGTLVHALASGVPVATIPAAGDMTENGSRAQWAGVGLSLPRRFLGPRTLRCVVQRILEEPSFKRRAGELAEWGRRNNGPDTAAMLVERFASL